MSVCMYEGERTESSCWCEAVLATSHPSPLLGHWAYALRGSLVNTPVDASHAPHASGSPRLTRLRIATPQGRWPGAWGAVVDDITAPLNILRKVGTVGIFLRRVGENKPASKQARLAPRAVPFAERAEK